MTAKTTGMLFGALLLVNAIDARAQPDDPAATQDDAGESRAVTDAPALRRSVQAALDRDPALKKQRIDVALQRCRADATSERCNVTLTGTVSTQAERAAAERAARVKGVVLIDNRLELADSAKDGVPDGAVTSRVREQLLADDVLKSAVISVDTTAGVVTLVGAVPSETARTLALDITRKTPGVKRVAANDLRVELLNP